MSSSLQDSILLITSTNPNNTRFGTGFVIHKDEHNTYALTCAHVIDDVDGSKQDRRPVKADKDIAWVIALADDRFPDLAVLKVRASLDKSPLHLGVSGDTGSAIVTAGWFRWSGQQRQIKELQCKLGKHVELTLEGTERVSAWDLEITDEDSLEPGYSGSPVVEEASGHVLGVVSDRQREGKRGLAISIEALGKIWPEMPPGLIEQDYQAERSNFVTTDSSRSQGRKIPPLLPYLVNRKEQEDKLADIILKELNLRSRRPLAILIHGDEHECLDTYVDRLKEEALPKLLDLDREQTAVTRYHLEWPTQFRDEDELHEKLQRHLSDEILKRNLASAEEVNNSLAGHPGPVLIYTCLLTEDWERQDPKVLTSFLRFWCNWPELGSGQRLIICLFIKYQVKQNLWKKHRFRYVNRKIEKILETLPVSELVGQLNCTVLPKLEGVSRRDAESWARSRYVRSICKCEEVFTEIRETYRQWESQTSSDRIPMETLAPLLKDMLRKYSLGKGGII